MAKKNGFVTIQDWMFDLGLDAREILLYATIYGFSQDEESVFNGSREYLCRRCCCELRNLKYLLTKMMEKGLIEKVEEMVGNVKRCRYKAIIPNEKEVGQKLPGAKIARGKMQQKGGAKIALLPGQNLPTENKVENKDIYIKTKQTSLFIKKADEIDDLPSPEISPKESCAKEKTPDKIKYAEFVSMTEANYQALLNKYGETDTRWLIEKLDNYKGSTGKRYKDDYRAILSWVVNELENNKSKITNGSDKNIERSKRGGVDTTATSAKDYRKFF